jgi:hypothetical protein
VQLVNNAVSYLKPFDCYAAPTDALWNVRFTLPGDKSAADKKREVKHG